MEQRVLCAVAAAARGAAFVQQPAPEDRLLEPPHPAFVGFRRMTYLWLEDNTMQPIGDRIRLWIEFLRAQGVTAVSLDLSAREPSVNAAGAAASSWHVFEDEGMLTMRGRRADLAAVTRADPSELADHTDSAALADHTDPAALMDHTNPATAARDLNEALARAIATADGLRREELERAQSILASDDDGSEVGDVAWPYFVLPDPPYGPAERRLFAAAAGAWPAPRDGAWRDAAPAPPDALLAAASTAVMAAVNSPDARQPVK